MSRPAGPPLRFGILGPLEVDDAGRRLDLGRPKQRVLLAVLLIHANSVVSVDKLVDDLWAGRPPEDAYAALQVQVSRLRRALAGGAERRVTVESRKPGYLLRVDPGCLDSARFEQLVKGACDAMAGASPGPAMAQLDQALQLWRGPALAEFADEPFAMSEAARLEELRLVAQEERVALPHPSTPGGGGAPPGARARLGAARQCWPPGPRTRDRDAHNRPGLLPDGGG